MRWGTIGMGGAWVLIGGPMRWGTNEMGDQWDGGPLGLAENGWTNEKGDQWEGGPMSSNNVVGDLWIGAPMRRGPMRWGTNEMGDQWVGGTNEMGDQWNEWCMGANWGINEMGDQWDGGPMRWGTNEMGDQWDGGPMMCTLDSVPKDTNCITDLDHIGSGNGLVPENVDTSSEGFYGIHLRVIACRQFLKY